jgi:uncharacterized metal-binding protein YceD (DUF177 family)
MSAAVAPEWSHIIDVRHLPQGAFTLGPDETQRRRLAGRFAISAIDRLDATVTIEPVGSAIAVRGRIVADIVQPCAISGEDFATAIDEPVDLRFVTDAAPVGPAEEIEITADQCDEIDFDGASFDLGEALAQSLALAIDPFAQGPDADRARADHGLGGETGGGAFAALAALRQAPPA